MFEELCFGDTIGDLHLLLDLDFEGDDKIINVHSKKFYDEVKEFMDRYKVQVDTKYKTIVKNVKAVALPLLSDCEFFFEKASMQPNFRDSTKLGHEFKKMSTLDGLRVRSDDLLTNVKRGCFKKMLSCHGKAFAFELYETPCVDLNIVTMIVIFTISYTSWNL